MPYTIRRTSAYRRGSCFSVSNAVTGKKFAKCTTKKKALHQTNLLRAIQYNPGFKRKLRRTTRLARRAASGHVPQVPYVVPRFATKRARFSPRGW